MKRALWFWSFIAVALGLTAGLHYYIWARLVRDVALGPALHLLGGAVVTALCISIPASFWLERRSAPERTRPLLLFTFGWLGVLLLLLVFLAASDLVRFVAELVRVHWLGRTPLDAASALVVARYSALAVVGTTAVLSALAARSGLGRVRVRTVEISLERLPEELDGFKIAQLSDVHVGSTIGRAFVEQIVATTNGLEPEIVTITGDLVDGSVHQLRESVAPLAGFTARAGVYFVTGNHEYYSGASAWCRELEGLGIRVLRNERVEVGRDGATFDLAGIDDYTAHQFGRGHGANLPRALAGRDSSRELVLLAHQPRAIFEAAQLDVGLQLSGHTHGGQLWPWNYMVRLQQPVVSGLSRFGRAQLYVSNGTGYWGPPMRLGAPAEITCIVLRAARRL